MHTIELFYIAALVASVFAMAPQVKQLFMAKESDELNLNTWLVWASYQAIALVYSISEHMVLYSIVNASWIVFYAIMLTLIIRYRRHPKSASVPALIDN